MLRIYSALRRLLVYDEPEPEIRPDLGRTLQEKLFYRWKLNEYWMSKSMMHSTRENMEDEAIYGEVQPRKIMDLIPDCLTKLLLDSEFRLEYDNGSPGNHYDPRTNKAVIKGTNDLLHEIGHGLWYNLIPENEKDKREAAVNTLADSREHRLKLDEEHIPTMHKQYAALVGAYSGQFLYEHYDDNRRNDLEEHFARNFDYLLKGKPLEALPESTSTIGDFLEFYLNYGVIDDEFKRFYRISIYNCYNLIRVKRRPLRKIADGDRITTKLIERVKELKVSLKS